MTGTSDTVIIGALLAALSTLAATLIWLAKYVVERDGARVLQLETERTSTLATISATLSSMVELVKEMHLWIQWDQHARKGGPPP